MGFNSKQNLLFKFKERGVGLYIKIMVGDLLVKHHQHQPNQTYYAPPQTS